MLGTCERCSTSVPLAGVGRARRYCTDACRQAAYRERHRSVLPAELTAQPRWVRRFGKRPVTVAGWAASVTDPSTWTDYKSAQAASKGDGIGFVLGDGIGCLDLDHVIDERGRLDPAAGELLATLPATFTEVSQSGTGLHVFGLLPEGPGRARKVGGVSVETYSRGRYIAVTGNRWKGAPSSLADLSAALAW